MIYVTIKTNQNHQPPPHQIDFQELLRQGYQNYQTPATSGPVQKPYFKTFAFLTERGDNTHDNLLRNYPIREMQGQITTLAEQIQPLLLPPEEMQSQYDTFYIPKHSGGMRRIDAPKPPLMNALSQVKFTFENGLYVLPHNAAHAYTQQRSIVTAMQLHQQNESKW